MTQAAHPSGCARAAPGPRPRWAGRRRPVEPRADAVVGEGEIDGARYGGRAAPARPGRDARGRVVLRRALVRPPGGARARAGVVPAAFMLAREGHGSTVPAVVAMSRLLRQVPRHGRRTTSTRMQRGRVQVSVPAVLGDGRLSWAEPCVPYAGDQVGCFAVPPVGARRLGGVRGAATPTTRSSPGASGASGQAPARRRCRRQGVRDRRSDDHRQTTFRAPAG